MRLAFSEEQSLSRESFWRREEAQRGRGEGDCHALFLRERVRVGSIHTHIRWCV